MGVRSTDADATSVTATRLKREDFRRTKHDSAFSRWKILIGASDWEDYSMRKGVERYRTQNLPNGTSCPGVYELGIAKPHSQSRRETRKLDSSSVIPVYLGQSDNLRNRMQQYGRDGDHLENGGYVLSKIYHYQSAPSRKGPGLFTDIFSRGLPIVYRYAPMSSKQDAEITEKKLLDRFDYAWNKGSNGLRRQDDIHKKLDRLEKASKFSLLAKEFLFYNQREVGIKIRSGSNTSKMDNAIFSRILGVRRLQARPVQDGSADCGNTICGVAIGHGSVCTAPPVAGRKRCAMHKGQRVNGYISRADTQGKPPFISDFQDHKLSYITEKHHPCDHAPDKEFNITCGFILEDNSSCKNSPVRGNKRCLEHKGRRIRRSNLSLQGKNSDKFIL